ncbi:MAG: 3-keto-5-aminohexanoate cleavage protein [Actinomycetota bacterium]|nr:3-keto-5-aminohexanoate cleavage protein [Actinomycetota bacterium]
MSRGILTMMLLQACLNGSRTSEEHPGIPRTPAELADQGRASVAAGAQVLHLHSYDEAGSETFAAEPCAAALRAVRVACPGVPISFSTSADIEPHPRRLESIAHWIELPDLVTANQGEEGIAELSNLFITRGVGIEAGLLHLDDAHRFVKSGLVDRSVRVLIEPLDADPSAALAHAAAMEKVLVDAGVVLEQVHHGDGVATWHVMARAIERGHGIRAGLEDTTRLPDGEPASDNATLVRLGARMLAGESLT